MLAFYNTILLRSVWARTFMEDAMIRKKGGTSMIKKITGIIGANTLDRGVKLSTNKGKETSEVREKFLIALRRPKYHEKNHQQE